MSDIYHGRSCDACSPPQDTLCERSLLCPGMRIRVGAFHLILNKSSSSGSLRMCTLSTPRHTLGRRRSSLPLQSHCSVPHRHRRACAASSVLSDMPSSSSVLAGNGCIDLEQHCCRSPRRSPWSDRPALRSRVVQANARLLALPRKSSDVGWSQSFGYARASESPSLVAARSDR